MFGKYGIYVDGKMVGSGFDDQLFIKLTRLGRAMPSRCWTRRPTQVPNRRRSSKPIGETTPNGSSSCCASRQPICRHSSRGSRSEARKHRSEGPRVRQSESRRRLSKPTFRSQWLTGSTQSATACRDPTTRRLRGKGQLILRVAGAPVGGLLSTNWSVTTKTLSQRR